MKLLATFAATTSLLSTIASATVGIQSTFYWKTPNVSSSGLKDITFPMYIADAPHKHGYYFAQQYRFNGIDQIGYTGLQPQDDSGNTSVIHAVFSTFADGSHSTDKQCSSGADGASSGVSCAVDVPVASYDHLYHLVVKNGNGTTWSGTLVDTVTHKATHIGSYTLPAKAGGIKGQEQGFLEYFPFNSGDHKCEDLPFTNATYFPPFSSGRALNSSSLTKPSGYGDCGKKSPPDAKPVQNGYQISAGS